MEQILLSDWHSWIIALAGTLVLKMPTVSRERAPVRYCGFWGEWLTKTYFRLRHGDKPRDAYFCISMQWIYKDTRGVMPVFPIVFWNPLLLIPHFPSAAVPSARDRSIIHRYIRQPAVPTACLASATRAFIMSVQPSWTRCLESEMWLWMIRSLQHDWLDVNWWHMLDDFRVRTGLKNGVRPVAIVVLFWFPAFLEKWFMGSWFCFRQMFGDVWRKKCMETVDTT